jgi:AsmA protein
MKVLLGIGLAIVLIVGILVALPFLVDLSQYQDQYKPPIETALNRKIQLQGIRLTLWPRIGARVSGFTVLDDPAFGTGPFASLGSLDIGVQLLPLLSGKVEVEEITLREPVITVIKNKNGVLNVSTLGRTGVAAPETPSRAPIPSTEGPLKILAMLAVDRVTVVGGTVTYRDLSAAKPSEYGLQDLDVRLTAVRLGQTPRLHLDTMVQPLNIPVTLEGTFGPLKETTDLDAIHLQLALGKTTLAVTGKTVGRNASLNVSAPVIKSTDLPVALPLHKPVEIETVQVAADVQGQDVLLRTLSFQLFNGQVKAQGKVTTGSPTPPFAGTLTLQGLQLGPALDAVAPSQMSISGTAGADVNLQGRGFAMPDLTKALEGTGHLTVRDGKIEGVNLLQEAIAVLKVAGIALDNPKVTAFSTIETDVAVAQGLVTVQRLLMDSHDFQATGGGTIGFDRQLNLTVNLNLSQDLSQQLAGASPVVRMAMKDGRVSLPVTITGTTQGPSYGVDMKALTGKVQEQVQKKVEEAVGGLLKGTTKPKDLEQQGKDLLKGLLGR